MLLPSLSMVFDGSGPLVKRCHGFDGSLWSTALKCSLLGATLFSANPIDRTTSPTCHSPSTEGWISGSWSLLMKWYLWLTMPDLEAWDMLSHAKSQTGLQRCRSFTSYCRNSTHKVTLSSLSPLLTYRLSHVTLQKHQCTDPSCSILFSTGVRTRTGPRYLLWLPLSC